MSYPVPPANLLHLTMASESARRELRQRDRKLRQAKREGLDVWYQPADDHAVPEVK